jgi:hypothetical protein
VRLDPPLDPTSAQAREWLEAELRKGSYHESPGLLQRLWDWLSDVLLSTTTGGSLPWWTVWLAVLVGVGVVALLVARSVRAERRMRGPRDRGVLEGPVRPASEHRAAARAALADGDADTAVLEGYRAIARSAVERTLLDDLPGRTAHEVSVDLGPAFPVHTAALASAADAFDAVRYGRRSASVDTARAVLALDDDLSRARPVLPEPVAGAGVTP